MRSPSSASVWEYSRFDEARERLDIVLRGKLRIKVDL